MRLRIGKIPYANLFPIFYILENESDCTSYEFIEGVPSTLNKMLRDGDIDVSPSSSIEYLKNPSLYQIIEGHSISSRGPIGSIFLFSKKNIYGLNNSTVHVSSQSETSIALLDIILKKFYGIQCKMQVSRNPENSGADAFLLIGDDAIKYKARGNRQEAIGNRQEARGNRQKAIGKSINKHTIYSPSPIAYRPFVYDLGEIWYEKTGLPFVFALWIARKKLFEGQGSRVKGQKELLNKFVKDLNTAKEIALKKLIEIAQHSPMKEFMPEEEIISYWNKIDYELTAEHKRGLDLFNRYLKELSYF